MLLTVLHSTCSIPFDQTPKQLPRKHLFSYLGNSQNTYIRARGGRAISSSQESGNNATDALSEDSPVNLKKMVKYLFLQDPKEKAQ